METVASRLSGLSKEVQGKLHFFSDSLWRIKDYATKVLVSWVVFLCLPHKKWVMDTFYPLRCTLHQGWIQDSPLWGALTYDFAKIS